MSAAGFEPGSFRSQADSLTSRPSWTQQQKVLDYNRANLELMKEQLSSNNYEVLMRNKNVKEYYMILKEKIAIAKEHHIQTKKIRPINGFLWFSEKIYVSSIQDNSHTEDLNDTKHNPIVKNTSTPAELLNKR
ncbi:hypothetical protein FHG87_016462 [Trinorchestia longiramus]|nr:hypothetical protein FHG87_016462 [Trinorchestia longiramus]